MRLIDLLLVAALVLLVAAAAMVAPTLGVAAGGVACGVLWFLLGDG